MSGASIAAEVAAALVEVARDVGDGSFTVTLIRPAPASTPWGTGGADTETELAAMVSAYPRNMVDGTLIRATDRRVMLSATGTVPLTTDRLDIAGTEHTIVSVREIAPSGVPLFFECQARV